MFIIDYLIVVALDEETGYTYEILERELGLKLKIQPADAALVSGHAIVELTGESGPSEELLVVVSPGEMGHSAMAAVVGVINAYRSLQRLNNPLVGAFLDDYVQTLLPLGINQAAL